MSKYKTGVVRRLADKNLIDPPSFVEGSVQYETMMGSVAYGVSSDTSDIDVYGFCIPPKDIVFPHTAGYIHKFSTQVPSFDQFQIHHIQEPDSNKQYDLQIYSIVKYFRLCMDCNPNMIDSLFTPRTAVLNITKIGEMVRDNRKLFLHKGAWHRFRGYAYSQMNKIKSKSPDKDGTRRARVDEHGYDTKFAYHVVRLMDEVEQILENGDIDLMRNKEQLKSVKRGEWTLEEVENHLARKEKQLEELYLRSSLPNKPPEESIKNLLLQCLEEFYGSLDNAIEKPDKYKDAVLQIRQIIDKM